MLFCLSLLLCIPFLYELQELRVSIKLVVVEGFMTQLQLFQQISISLLHFLFELFFLLLYDLFNLVLFSAQLLFPSLLSSLQLCFIYFLLFIHFLFPLFISSSQFCLIYFFSKLLLEAPSFSLSSIFFCMEMSISIIWLFSWAPLELSPGSLKFMFLIGGELARGVVKSRGLLSSGAISSTNIEVFPYG